MKILTFQGSDFLLDDDIYDRLKGESFGISEGGYLFINSRGGWPVHVHNLVCPSPVGSQVDHWNRNILDIQRSNLRVVTSSINRQNSTKSRINRQLFRGVSVFRTGWRARIKPPKGKELQKVGFTTPEAAAKWYDLMVDVYYPGGFKNFP